MQALLDSAFGTSLLGGAPTMASLEMEGESVKEAFLQPQPVGLTNIQCKVVGPYFTSHPTHQHPEATLASFAGAVYEAPTDFLAEHPVKDEGVLGHVHLNLDQAVPAVDPDERGMDFILLASAMPDPEAVMEKAATTGGETEGDAGNNNDGDGAGGNRVILQEALKVEAELDDEARERLHRLLCSCPVQLTGQPYGHQMERALSLALLGTDCHWNVINQELLKCFDSAAALDSASRNLGLDSKALSSFKPYLSTGLPVPMEATICMWYFAAQFLQRTIVVYQGPNAKVTMAFAPDVEDPATLCKRPLLIYDEGTGKPKSAIVPVQPLDPKFDQPMRFRLSGHFVLFPQRLDAAAVLDLEGADSASQGGGAESKQQSVLEGPLLLINHPMCNDPKATCGVRVRRDFSDLNCAQYLGHDPKVLSFESFPPTYFALADNAEVANELLHTPGFGIDDSGSTDYLEGTLAKMHNVSPVHVDADGHCLTHSLSRCLIGKEYLWHALRHQLWLTMDQDKEKYLAHFKRSKFLTALDDEMDTIIKRAHPEYTGEDGDVLSIGRGLGTEHIFVLSNVLKRPILLLDVQGTAHSEGFLFLPLLVDPSKVVTKKLLVVAWNNSAHQHYVPVVPIDGSKVAAIPDSELPRSHEDVEKNEDGTEGDQEYLVYGCPDDVKSSTLVKQYVEFQDMEAKAPSGSPTSKKATPMPEKTAEPVKVRHAIIGGESPMDIRAWAQGICDLYREKHGLSIWAMHEVCRFLLKSGKKHAHELGTIRDIHVFDKLCVKIAHDTKLYYCPVCTGTTDQVICCEARKALKPINVVTGRFDYKECERMPLESTPGFSCCVYKHWCQVKTIKVGDPVFARDVGTAFQLGFVERIHDTEDQEFDIRFRAGSAAAIRYCCPQEEIMFGFPTDMASHEHHFSAAGYSCDALVVWDANDKLRFQVDRLTNEVSAKIMKKLPQQYQMAENFTKIKMLVQHDVEYLKSSREQTCKIKAQVRNRMSNRQQATHRVARGTAREKKYKDEKGNTMMWQSMDPISHEWLDYDHESTGVLEGAFQDGGLSQEINIQGYGVFTVHFRTWFQENSQGFGRQVRRVAMKEWNCASCTYENPGTRAQCEMCQGHRPKDAFEVVGDKAMQKELDAIAEQEEENFDENDEEVDAKYAMLEAELEKDDRLKAGNEYGNLFRDACRRANCFIVHHNQDYIGVHFIFWEADQRWIPIPARLHPGHRLYDFVKAGTCKEIKAQNLKLYTRRSLKYMAMNDSDECVLIQLSTY